MSVRPTAVAGAFYPGDAQTLASMIDGFLAQVEGELLSPKVVVSPHAGFIYSGLTAAYAYRQLQSREIERILLVGPSHHVYFEGFAFSGADRWTTPLGEVELDQGDMAAFLKEREEDPAFFLHDQPHEFEHSLEVQVPFLQRSLARFKLVPVCYGKSDYRKLAAVFDHFLADEKTVAVVSSDLSHFHPQAQANRVDAFCNRAVETLDLDAMDHCEACGAIGMKAAIAYAQRQGLKSKVLDYRTSGDTAGDKNRVVGYGSYAFY